MRTTGVPFGWVGVFHHEPHLITPSTVALSAVHGALIITLDNPKCNKSGSVICACTDDWNRFKMVEGLPHVLVSERIRC